MQNVHVASGTGFHALSNGRLVLAVSLILRYVSSGKWRKLFTEAVLALKLNFQQLGLNLRGKPRVPFERAQNACLERALDSTCYFVCICTT